MQRFDYRNLEREWWFEEYKQNHSLNNGVFNGEGNVRFQRLPRKVVLVVRISVLFLRGSVT